MTEIHEATTERQAILETVRRFVEHEVRPRSAALDARPNPEDCFSWELIEKAHELGLRTMTLEEKWGGLGLDSLTTAMVVEELATGDMGLAVVLAQTFKIAQLMQAAFNDEQRARVLPAFAKDPRGLLAIGMTEPGNGSDKHTNQPVPFRTSASRAPGGWVVNGMKHFISNGNRASHYLLMVQTDRGKTMANGSTCFLLERGRPGFTIGRVHDKMGERLANNAELVFQDCFVPDANVVGAVDKGSQVFARFSPQSNAYAGATVLGVAVALHRKAIDWASTRVQGGRRLIEHDGIRAQLAEMRMLIDASRAYVHRACWLADHQETGWDGTLGALPKAMAAQSAWKIATWTLEIHGGHGYMKEAGVEKLVRDAAAFLHSDGVNRTLFLKVANAMFGAMT
ncbi:MAG: acyl-CoA dehydrogenase family protein [Burkholderiales bacterium]|nr:acyl-CoA dehydrogenase family protein [Burkholderiales bacterium]